MGPYAAAYERSLGDPARFWAEAARDIRWRTPPERVLDDGAAPSSRTRSGGVRQRMSRAASAQNRAGSPRLRSYAAA